MSARALPIAARLSKPHLALIKLANEALGDGWILAMSASEERAVKRLEPTFVEMRRRSSQLWEYRITSVGRNILHSK